MKIDLNYKRIGIIIFLIFNLFFIQLHYHNINISPVKGFLNQSGGTGYYLYYPTMSIVNFTTYYQNTEVEIDLNMNYTEGNINLTVLDHTNMIAYINNESYESIFQLKNLHETEIYNIIVPNSGLNHIVLENFNHDQEVVHIYLFLYYNEDSFINPDTIILYLFFGSLILILLVSAVLIWRKFR